MLDQTLNINEIFFSLQGESSFVGRPCSFVRLTGCPLRCSWCDTTYSFYEGQKKSFNEIISVLDSYPTRLVEVTGGEPLAQKNVIPFMELLIEKNFEVMLETSGALTIEKVPRDVKIIMDLKAPASGEMKKNYWDNLAWLKPGIDEIKIVVQDKNDFDFAVEIEKQHNLTRAYTVLLSPVHGKVDLPQFADWILNSQIPFRMQMQLHKLVWGAETKGV